MSFGSGPRVVCTVKSPRINLELFVSNRLAALGPISQLAFVPQDFDAALQYWTGTMGAGPFFTLEHVAYREARYRGRPTDIDFSMALGYWGDMQIELIRQNNDAPSIYSDWRRAGRDGLHHVCIVVDDIAPARATCAAADASIVQEIFLDGAEGIYVAPGGTGMLVEILKPSPAILELFTMMRNAARDWDGSNPIRSLG